MQVLSIIHLSGNLRIQCSLLFKAIQSDYHAIYVKQKKTKRSQKLGIPTNALIGFCLYFCFFCRCIKLLHNNVAGSYSRFLLPFDLRMFKVEHLLLVTICMQILKALVLDNAHTTSKQISLKSGLGMMCIQIMCTSKDKNH